MPLSLADEKNQSLRQLFHVQLPHTVPAGVAQQTIERPHQSASSSSESPGTQQTVPQHSPALVALS